MLWLSLYRGGHWGVRQFIRGYIALNGWVGIWTHHQLYCFKESGLMQSSEFLPVCRTLGLYLQNQVTDIYTCMMLVDLSFWWFAQAVNRKAIIEASGQSYKASESQPRFFYPWLSGHLHSPGTWMGLVPIPLSLKIPHGLQSHRAGTLMRHVPSSASNTMSWWHTVNQNLFPEDLTHARFHGRHRI